MFPTLPEQIINLASECNRFFRNAGDATARVALETADKLKDNAAVSHAAQLASKAAVATIDAGRQVYHQVNDIPVTEKILHWKNSAVSSVVTTAKDAFERIDYGKYANLNSRDIIDNAITRSAIRCTIITLGSYLLFKIQAQALRSGAGKRHLRASSIRNSIRVYNWLYLPSLLRSTAVAVGVTINNLILSGIGPGLVAVWAIYEWCGFFRLTYEMILQ